MGNGENSKIRRVACPAGSVESLNSRSGRCITTCVTTDDLTSGTRTVDHVCKAVLLQPRVLGVEGHIVVAARLDEHFGFNSSIPPPAQIAALWSLGNLSAGNAHTICACSILRLLGPSCALLPVGRRLSTSNGVQ